MSIETPNCPQCGKPMWLTRVTQRFGQDLRNWRCIECEVAYSEAGLASTHPERVLTLLQQQVSAIQ